MKRKRLLWDFGGTLADLTDSWSGLGIAALNDQLPGHTITRDQIRPFLSSGFPWHSPEVEHGHISSADAWWQEWIEPLFERIFETLGVQPKIATVCAKQIRFSFLDPRNWQVFEDTVPTLETLTRLGWSHAIISKFSPGLEELLEQLGLLAHFTHVFNSAEIGFEKPNPRIFQHVLETLDHPETVWMIGDNPRHDVLGAEALGIPGILIRGTSDAVSRSSPDLYGVIEIVTAAED